MDENRKTTLKMPPACQTEPNVSNICILAYMLQDCKINDVIPCFVKNTAGDSLNNSRIK